MIQKSWVSFQSEGGRGHVSSSHNSYGGNRRVEIGRLSSPRPQRQQILQPGGAVRQWMGLNEKGHGGWKLCLILYQVASGLQSDRWLRVMDRPHSVPFWAPAVSRAGNHTHVPLTAHTPSTLGQGLFMWRRADLLALPFRYLRGWPTGNKRGAQDICQSPTTEMIWNNWAKDWLFFFQMLTSSGRSSHTVWYFIGCFSEVLTGLLGAGGSQAGPRKSCSCFCRAWPPPRTLSSVSILSN